MLVISGSPRDEGFFAGLANFSFTCSATLNPSVDPGVTVSTSWERNGSPLISTDGIMVGVASSLVGLVSNSSVMFTSLGLNDAGNYTCRVNVTAVDSTFILGTTNSTTRDIVVESRTTINYIYFNKLVNLLILFTYRLSSARSPTH